jgi:Mrp family chromosome partitioning ATPase
VLTISWYLVVYQVKGFVPEFFVLASLLFLQFCVVFEQVVSKYNLRLQSHGQGGARLVVVSTLCLKIVFLGRMKPPPSLSGVRYVLGIVSGKGGVGKSTVAANLAIAFALSQKRVGLLDADIYGPSLPTIMNLRGLPLMEGKKMLPLENHGVKVMSMGFVIPSEASPAVWRGPMASSALGQLINNTEWGELDVLVVDLPPGTGDVHLTLAQSVALSGCAVVSTPQVYMLFLFFFTECFKFC